MPGLKYLALSTFVLALVACDESPTSESAPDQALSMDIVKPTSRYRSTT